MIQKFNFNFIANYNIDKIKNIVSQFKDEWLVNTERQQNYEEHQKTYSYFIYDYDLNWKANNPYEMIVATKNIELINSVDFIVKDLEKKYNGKVGRVILTKLVAKGEIPFHVDSGDYLIMSHRNHIPIISNDTSFSVGGETIEMKEGECWEINNSKIHNVKNNSTLDRVHLIIDILPNEIIGEGNVRI